MARVFLLVNLFLLISLGGSGQCVNPPTITLSRTSGSTCGSTPITVSNNIFGGNATSVTIKEDGSGSVSPSFVTTSPFAFTYSPKSVDAGKKVIITLTTNDPAGPCTAAVATYTLTVNVMPSAPSTGTITMPTCTVATGSVVLNGLPSAGTWIVTRLPGGAITTGTGTSAVISGIPAGSFTFTVTNSVGCTSPASSAVVINAQPSSPASPVHIVDCTLGYGKAVVRVTSPTGTGLQYRLDSGTFQSGTSFTNVANGNHTITVRNSSGCITTGAVFQVSCICANQPVVTLSSSSGNICGVTPVAVGNNTFGGSATSVTITENGAGMVSPSTSGTSPFTFTYTPAPADGGHIVIITVTTNNPLGLPCEAASASYSLTVNTTPSAPVVGTITQPVCTVATGSVVLSGLPSGGTWGLTRSPGGVTTTGTGTSTIISGLAAGTYTFTVTNVAGCTSASSSNVIIMAQSSSPTAPVIGTITRPTCTVSTGSVLLSGLPSAGSWTLIRSPGGVTTAGSGTSTTVTSLLQGTYTFTVTNSAGCNSPSSAGVIIPAQPVTPAAPTVGTVTPPTCTIPTGGIVLNGLPSVGSWTLTRYPGTIITVGSGANASITGLSAGIYNYMVTNSDGCFSVLSSNVNIPAQPVTPSAPQVGTITQPVYQLPTGSVVLNGLPATGIWILTRTPGSIFVSGTGTVKTVTGLDAGTYNFTVTNSEGCASEPSAEVVILAVGGPPLVIITDPAPVCSPLTVNLTAPEVVAGSDPGLSYTYWTNASATVPYDNPSAATAGTFYIKGTNSSGVFTIKPVNVTVDRTLQANAGPDQFLEYTFKTTMNADLIPGHETGLWSLVTGSGIFLNSTDPGTEVSGLALSKNKFLWTLKNGVCPATSDTITVVVKDLIIPTLITPNMDGKNDFLILRGLENLGKTQLMIFDRSGVRVWISKEYNNLWDGVDYKGDPLPDGTYFYVLRTAKGKSVSGYIVVRR